MDHERIVNVTHEILEKELPAGTMVTITVRIPGEVNGDAINFTNFVCSNDCDPDELVRLTTEAAEARKPEAEEPSAL